MAESVPMAESVEETRAFFDSLDAVPHLPEIKR